MNNLDTASAYGLVGLDDAGGNEHPDRSQGQLGETTVTLPVGVALPDLSPRHLIYLVSGPVTYLCDEGQGTLRRYENYAIAANHAARDAPGDFPGAGELIARGLTTCNFAVSLPGGADVADGCGAAHEHARRRNDQPAAHRARGVHAMSRSRQRGVSLVAAIFLIVVVASLAAFAVTAGASQGDSANLQLESDRALAAARAGSEWAAYRALRQNGCAANSVLSLSQAGLRGFRVTVTCTWTDHIEGATNYRVYDVTSFAQWGTFGSVNYASRRVVSRFSNAP